MITKKIGNIFQTQWVIAESNFQISLRAGIVFQNQNVIIGCPFHNHSINNTELGIYKSCVGVKVLKSLVAVTYIR